MRLKYITAILLSIFILMPFNAFSAPKRIAIFVNGDQNCCASNMNKTWNALAKMGINVDYSAWNSITDHNMGSNPRNTKTFVNSAIKYFNSLPKGTEVYLIGHSFGGDSILQLINSYHRTHVKFRLVAILDAVGVAGTRDVTKRNKIPSSVDYFFNRWQTNAPWPVDIKNSGKISCRAKTCDQKKQNISRHPNGSARKTRCGQHEACPGKKIIFQGIKTRIEPGHKQTRLHHSFVPTDPLIEEQLIRIVKNLVSSTQVTTKESYMAHKGSTCYTPGDGRTYCCFKSPGHYQLHRFGKNHVSRGGRAYGLKYTGVCGSPPGYFAWKGSTLYSNGAGSYCGFSNPTSYEKHGNRNSRLPRFGNLSDDPKRFMSYTGVCR